MDYEIKELTDLYLEAVGLVIKLVNKLKYEHCKDAENHIAAAEEFINKNDLYRKIIKRRSI